MSERGKKTLTLRLRRLSIAAVVLLLVYTLAGFLLVPGIAKSQMVRHFEEELGLRVSIESLRTNPYTLTARAEGFAVHDAQGVELLGLDDMFVNFQLSTLFRWAWTFKEIRVVNPRIEVVVNEDGSVNLESLVADSPDATPESGGARSLPRVVVHSFELDSGRAGIEDRTRPVPFRTMIGPTSFSLAGFSTLPEDHGELFFEAELESGARFTWQGTIGVNPIRSEGRIALANGHMPITKRYLQDRLRFRIADGRSDGEVDYAVALEGEDVRLRLSQGSFTVRDLVVILEDDHTELLRLPEMGVTGIELSWPERQLKLDRLALTGTRLVVWRNPDGELDLLEHLAVRQGGDSTTAEEDAQPSDDEPAGSLDDWEISLSRLVIDDLGVSVEDRTVDPPFRTAVENAHAEIRNIDNVPGSTFDLSIAAEVETGGSLAVEGKLGVLPGPTLDAAVKLEDLALVPLQAYVEELARLRIESGTVSLDGQVTSEVDESLRYLGNAELLDFSCRDVRRDERLLGIGRMELNDLSLGLTAARARIARVGLDRPYGRLTIYSDGTTNIGDVFSSDAGAEEGSGGRESMPSGEPALPFAIEIGEVRISGGSADFADMSLPLPFASHLDALEGDVSRIATDGTPSRIEIEGTVDEYGLARVEGGLDFFAPDRRSDVKVVFRNVKMSGLSPYSTKFAGHSIEEGRLSLDLHYVIESRRLDSRNEIVIEELTLGEKVESANAPNLPVKLAVAMLKDKNGRIELDIPVAGTLGDPEFAYGELVGKALKNVMKKVATAPFRALARLVGSDKDLEFIEFAAADSAILPPARETLLQLAGALAERPDLVLEVRGVFDPEIDAVGIREQKLDVMLANHAESRVQPEGAEPTPITGRATTLLEDLFVTRFTREELDALIVGHSSPADDGAEVTSSDGQPEETVLDLSTYLDAVRQRLVAVQPVSDEELARLAGARAESIRTFLEAEGVGTAAAVRTVEGGPVKKKDTDDDWVRLRLALSAR